jgi:GH15 family glucan-1,4-alpha-glucosidase
MTASDLRPVAARLRWLVQRSLAIIEQHQDPAGGFPASPTFPVYRFSWFRDGAFIADALSRCGRVERAERFFDWCAAVVEARAAQVDELIADRAAGRAISHDRFLPCRYRLDGSEDDGDWWDFQLDGYGTWLWAVAAHAERHGRSLVRLGPALALTARYVCAFWNEPCYDWWEEEPEQRHTSTVAALVGGLEAVARAGGLLPDALADEAAAAAAEARATVLADSVRDGRLTKWAGTAALDASLVSCATPFRLLAPTDPRMTATIAALELELAHGGVHRYLADTYYGGGEWVLLAALLGWHYAEVGRRDDALRQLDWIVARAGADGALPEQVSTHLLAPEREQEWIERWGPSASPLLWSHAMFLTLTAELGLLPELEAE